MLGACWILFCCCPGLVAESQAPAYVWGCCTSICPALMVVGDVFFICSCLVMALVTVLCRCLTLEAHFIFVAADWGSSPCARQPWLLLLTNPALPARVRFKPPHLMQARDKLPLRAPWRWLLPSFCFYICCRCAFFLPYVCPLSRTVCLYLGCRAGCGDIVLRRSRLGAVVASP